jgi:Helix-turn-helix.
MTIEQARKEKGMSRRDLSVWLEIPYRTLENWEKGNNQCPTYVEKLIIAEILRRTTKEPPIR